MCALPMPRPVLDDDERPGALPTLATAPASIDERRRRVGEVLERERVPGVAIALVGSDGPIWIGGADVADLGLGLPDLLGRLAPDRRARGRGRHDRRLVVRAPRPRSARRWSSGSIEYEPQIDPAQSRSGRSRRHSSGFQWRSASPARPAPIANITPPTGSSATTRSWMPRPTSKPPTAPYIRPTVNDR